MFRYFLSVIFSFFLAVQVGYAAERAEFSLIGHSADGQYFAFEEFGIQDGSGFAYSSIYVIDLHADEWVGGAPFEVRAEDETTQLAEIRSQAMRAASGAIGEYLITTPAKVIALNGDGEPEADELNLDFGIPGYSDPSSRFGDYELSFDIYDAPSGEKCMDYFGDKAKGFRLLLRDEDAISVVHEDSRIPTSRGCPVTYRASAVVTPFNGTDIRNAVALISVWAYGFEGMDRRYIAVPLGNGE
jgi:predicted secreted protein